MVILAGLAGPTSVQMVEAPFKAVVDCSVPPAGVHEMVKVLPVLLKLKVGPVPPIGGVTTPL